MRVPRRIFHIGNNERGEVWLTDEDLETHLHVKGLSRSGKSKLLMRIIRKIIYTRRGCIVFDPDFELYWEILKYAAFMGIQNILFFNPAMEKRIVGSNSFQTPYTDEPRIITKAERMVSATLKIFGVENASFFVNIERWLRCIYYVILEQKLSICDLDCFLYWSLKEKRDAIIKQVRSETIKTDLLEFYDTTKAGFKDDIKSTRNKLQRFIHPQVRRVMGLTTNNIDLEEILDNQQILVCNYQVADDDLIGKTSTRLIGTLKLNEIWEITRKRKNKVENYVIIDEAHEFLNDDIVEALPRCAKKGLHFILAHQEDSQLANYRMKGAMQNAQIKIFFRTEEDPKEKRWFTLRRPDHSTIEAMVPETKSAPVSDEAAEEYLEKILARFLSASEVDKLLATAQDKQAPAKQLTDEDFLL